MNTSPDTHRVLIIDILVRSFQNNPTLKALTSQHNHSRDVREIIEYSYDYARRRNGVLLSDEKKCAVLFFKNSGPVFYVSEYLRQFRLILTTVPIYKLFAILAHLRHIRLGRQAPPNHYYLWYLGAAKDSDMSTTRKFMLEIFEIAGKSRLPIYAETTLPKNKRVFERYGFETYKTWYNERLDITVYFMKRPATAGS